jgi:hypothetical protein
VKYFHMYQSHFPCISMFLEAFNCKFDEAILHKPPEPKQLR